MSLRSKLFGQPDGVARNCNEYLTELEKRAPRVVRTPILAAIGIRRRDRCLLFYQLPEGRSNPSVLKSGIPFASSV
jgi:hypothetical protein